MFTLRKVLGSLAFLAIAAIFGIGAIALVRPAAAAELAVANVHGGRGGFCGQAGLEAAAQALGLTADELQTQLRGGESLADVADAEGVELQSVLDAVTAACVQARRDAIAEAVADGTLTQAHADWLNEGLDQGFWGPAADQAGFGLGPRGDFGSPHGGFGGPRGGFGGHGFGRFGTAPTPTPAPSS